MADNMKKTKARPLERLTYTEEPTESTADKLTPECHMCGADHIGVGCDAVLILKGQWFPSVEYDVPVFLLDPETKLSALELPNGQVALIPDTLGNPSKHSHQECFDQLIDELYDTVNGEDDEDVLDELEEEYE